MTFFQHLELFAIDLTGTALIAATAYAILRLPWTTGESEAVWSLFSSRLRRMFMFSKHASETASTPSVVGTPSRRWIPIKVVQSC